MRSTTIDAILAQWRSEAGYAAGLRVMELVEVPRQVRLALRLVEICGVKESGSDTVCRAMTALQSSENWSGARAWFDGIRTEHLAETDDVRKEMLGLAEGAAKVAYNSTEPVASFDRDAFAKLFARVARHANERNQEVWPTLMEAAAAALARRTETGI